MQTHLYLIFITLTFFPNIHPLFISAVVKNATNAPKQMALDPYSKPTSNLSLTCIIPLIIIFKCLVKHPH